MLEGTAAVPAQGHGGSLTIVGSSEVVRADCQEIAQRLHNVPNLSFVAVWQVKKSIAPLVTQTSMCARW